MNLNPSPPQGPYYPAQAYGPGHAGYGPPARVGPKAPLWGLAPAAVALAFGAIGFLVAGFQGRRAGWEMLAIPTFIACIAAIVAVIPAVLAFARRGIGTGLATLGLAGFGALLGVVGFVLGS